MIPPGVDMSAVRRVLIIKMSALGDVIHALPVSAALKEAFPHIEITWAVEEAFAPLVSGNPYLAHVLTIPKMRGRSLRSLRFHREYLRRLRDIRTRRFDLTLDLQGLTKSAVVAAASGAHRRLGYHWLREAAGWVERPVPRRPESVHVVDQYLDVARFLGAEPKRVWFPFHVPDEDEQAVDKMLCSVGISPGSRFVSINPASAVAIKQWGAEKYARLMDGLSENLDIPTVLVTADKAVAAEVSQLVRRPFGNLSGRTNLKQLASVLRRSAVHVCGDTGSGHLAAALERPVVALIGPTDPDRACPYGQRANVVQHHEACGAACTGRRCEYDQPNCQAAITVSETFERVRRILSVS